MLDAIKYVFAKMVFVQYSFSTITLCSSVYAIARMPAFSPEFMACIVYIICMFIQIFNLCISGNRVTFEVRIFAISIT